VHGALKVRQGGDPETYLALGEVDLGGRGYRVLRASRMGKHLILTLAGVATREAAEALAGLEVQAEAARFPRLPEGEYYWFQLMGLAVRDARSGQDLGVVADILATPAHDVYVVRRPRGEWLLPAVDEVICTVNVEEGFMEVAPPAGLLELYAD
jgi:16S rRNA processing protein RimM